MSLNYDGKQYTSDGKVLFRVRLRYVRRTPRHFGHRRLHHRCTLQQDGESSHCYETWLEKKKLCARPAMICNDYGLVITCLCGSNCLVGLQGGGGGRKHTLVVLRYPPVTTAVCENYRRCLQGTIQLKQALRTTRVSISCASCLLVSFTCIPRPVGSQPSVGDPSDPSTLMLDGLVLSRTDDQQNDQPIFKCLGQLA